MLILLARIPAKTTKHDIADFLQPVLKGGLFFRKGIVESVEIMVYQDGFGQTIASHGLVRIEPDAAARRAISKLNRKPINGKHIYVREYHLRSWYNDRRMKNKFKKIAHNEKRESDRRRYKLIAIEMEESISFAGDKKFHRTF